IGGGTEAGAEGGARRAPRRPPRTESALMTRIVFLAAAGVLLFGSVCRAGEGHEIANPAQPAVTHGCVSWDAAPSGDTGCCGCHYKRSFVEWLFYRPLYKGKCCPSCQPACCYPALYAWFVDYCYAGNGAAYPLRIAPTGPCGCGHAH